MQPSCTHRYGGKPIYMQNKSKKAKHGTTLKATLKVMLTMMRMDQIYAQSRVERSLLLFEKTQTMSLVQGQPGPMLSNSGPHAVSLDSHHTP